MKLVVGLGNPGRKYQGTRHNVGFEVINLLAARRGPAGSTSKFRGQYAEVFVEGIKAGLLCPATYMNLSGQSVKAAVDFYKLANDQVLVVCDDFQLDLGRLRLRTGGSAGGQRGLQSVMDWLGSSQFPRLRIGIGTPPPEWESSDYVLSRFAADQTETITKAIERATDAVCTWITLGIQQAMNRFNAADLPIGQGERPPDELENDQQA